MKKQSFFLLVVVLVMLCQSAFAQYNNNDDNYYYRRKGHTEKQSIYPSLIFCFYPLAAITSNFKVGIERKLSDVNTIKTNVRFGFGDKSSLYTYKPNDTYNADISNFVMAMLEMQLRYYFSDKAPNGLYGGFYGFYKLANFSYVDNSSYYNYNTGTYVYNNSTQSQFLNGGGLGILFGVQDVLPEKIVLDVYMGSGVSFTSSGGNGLQGLNGVTDRYFNGIGFILGANVGLAIKK